MIKVSCYCKTGKWSGNPHETFIVKNPKKIKFWEALSSRCSTIKIEDKEKK